MKIFAILAAVTLAQAAKLDRVYLPPNAEAASGSNGLLQTPLQSVNGDYEISANTPISNTNAYAQNAYSDFDGRPERAQAAFERNAAILRQDNVNDGETYSYAYETENGIFAEENGVATNGVQAQGGYSYTGDDGKVYSVRYTADENGFVPQGDHLPTPPPIPEEILNALEKNARDEAAGIYDDGSYNDAKYAAASNGDQQYYNSNAQSINDGDDSISTNPADFRNGARLNSNNKYAGSNSKQQYYNAQPTNYNDDTVVSKSASLRNEAGFNGNSKYATNGNSEQRYYNKNAQPTNYNDDATNSNFAGLRNGPGINENSKYASASNNEQRYYNANAEPNYYKNDAVITNSAGFRNGPRIDGNTKYAAASNYEQQYYNGKVEPNNYRNEAVITNSASFRNGPNGNTKYAAPSNNEQRYYKTNVAPNNYNDDAINTNPASIRNGAKLNGNSVDKTYLPPVAQRNTNSRDGYRY